MKFYVVAMLLIFSVGLNLWQLNRALSPEQPMESDYYRTSISGTDPNDTGWCSDDGKHWWKARNNFMCYETDKRYGTMNHPGTPR